MNVDQNSSAMSSSYLLEINLVSAQELKPPRMKKKRMKTYAIAWVDPEDKLKSSIDKSGRDNPTWNDKFSFTFESDVVAERLTSCLVIEIYRVRRFLKDELIGRTRVLLCNLVNCSNGYQEGKMMMGTFRSFQVRLPNSEPYGILNLGFNISQGLPCQIMTEFLRMRKLAFQLQKANRL